MSSQFAMTGKLSTDPQHRDQLLEILLSAAELMQAIESCHAYIVAKDVNDETAVWVIELWESQEAHDQSLTMPAVRELIDQAMPMLKGQPEGATLLPVGGKGLKD